MIYLDLSLSYGLAAYIFHMLVRPGEVVLNLPKPAYDSYYPRKSGIKWL